MRVTLDADGIDCRPVYEADAKDWIVKAVVASEDGRFWEHGGVRLESIARAFWQNVTTRRRVSGASTITMQTVRLAKPHAKSYLQKWLEAVRAWKTELRRGKKWILSQYLNRAPFGSNFVGIEAAAQGWFGKSAKSLGPGEAALLAGLLQSPSRFRPDRHMDRAIKRRDYVLRRMKECGYIDEDGVEAAKSVAPRVAASPRPFLAPHYCDWFLAENPAEGRDTAMPLDLRVQRLCETAARNAALHGGCRAAAVVVEVETGDVVALADSEDWFSADAGKFVAAAAARPAGSTLKPLLCALAFDAALATPGLRLKDVPMPRRGYNPANFDGGHRGMVALKDALVLSLNIPFVQLLAKTGVTRFADLLRRGGFSHIGGDDAKLGLGLAIGNAEITPVELASAYAALAGGRLGVSREAAWMVAEILSAGGRGIAAPGHDAEVRAPRFAWKTGTSAAYRDAWTVAWNPQYCVAVWCGRLAGGFNDKALTGSLAAAPFALELARALYPSSRGPWFEKPEGVVSRKVCKTTGERAGAFCPQTEDDFAIAGCSSLAPCRLHRAGMTEDEALAAKPRKDALAIASPQNDAVIAATGAGAQQGIVFAAANNPDGESLWWFVDGRPAGETAGGGKLVATLPPGKHVVVCASMRETSAPVEFEVKK